MECPLVSNHMSLRSRTQGSCKSKVLPWHLSSILALVWVWKIILHYVSRTDVKSLNKILLQDLQVENSMPQLDRRPPE